MLHSSNDFLKLFKLLKYMTLAVITRPPDGVLLAPLYYAVFGLKIPTTKHEKMLHTISL